MKKTIIIFAFITFVSITGQVRAQSERISREKIQGIWEVTEVQSCGKNVTTRSVIDKVVLKGGKMIITVKGSKAKYTFKLAPAGKLKVIDLIYLDKNQLANLPPNSIYILREDSLALSFDDLAKIPIGFDTPKGSDCSIWIELKLVEKLPRRKK